MSEIRYNGESFGGRQPRRRRATPRQAGSFHNNRFYSDSGEGTVTRPKGVARHNEPDDVVYIDPPDQDYFFGKTPRSARRVQQPTVRAVARTSEPAAVPARDDGNAAPYEREPLTSVEEPATFADEPMPPADEPAPGRGIPNLRETRFGAAAAGLFDRVRSSLAPKPQAEGPLDDAPYAAPPVRGDAGDQPAEDASDPAGENPTGELEPLAEELNGVPASAPAGESENASDAKPADAADPSQMTAPMAAVDPDLTVPQPMPPMPTTNPILDAEVPQIDRAERMDGGLFELGLDPVDSDVFSIYGTEAEASGFADADFTPFPAPVPPLITADADAEAEAGSAVEPGEYSGLDPDSSYVRSTFGRARGFDSADPMSIEEAPRRRFPVFKGLLVLLAILAVLGGLGAWMWTHRSIEVTVNGQPMQVKPGQTLGEVYDPAEAGVKAGDLVSVTGTVLAAGAGDPYVVSINGEKIAPATASAHQLAAHDVIVYSDAENIVEDYDAQPFSVEPKLTVDGAGGSVAYISQWGYPGTSEVRTGKMSGEQVTVETDPVKDVVVTFLNPAPADDQKLIALTFDDGPSDYTDDILDLLDQYGAKATFFDLGEDVETRPDLSQEVVARGHQLASKTYSNQQLTAASAETVLAEVTDGFKALKEHADVETTVLRPPFGDLRARTWLETQGNVGVAVFWNIDTADDTYPGSSVIARTVLDSAYNGAVVRMHAGGGDCSQTIAALETILPDLAGRGFTFVTINELLASDSRISAEAASGNMTKPADSVWPAEVGEYRGPAEAA